MKTLLATAAAAGLLASPALAGALIYEPAPQAEVVVPAPAPAPALPSWTGGYVGGQLGWADAEIDGDTGDASDDGLFGGVYGGYDYDFGNNFVLGGELAYDRHDLSASSAGIGYELDNAVRATARGGYAFGNTLAYVKGGAEWLDGETTVAGDSSGASDWGWVAGAGVEHRVTERVTAGAEYLYHRVDDFGDAGDLTANTIAARVSYRF
jgi:opacity protein-like surface antigen